jgi:hypothetical protein
MYDGMIMRSVYLSSAEDTELQQYAFELGVTKNELIRAAVYSKLIEWREDTEALQRDQKLLDETATPVVAVVATPSIQLLIDAGMRFMLPDSVAIWSRWRGESGLLCGPLAYRHVLPLPPEVAVVAKNALLLLRDALEDSLTNGLSDDELLFVQNDIDRVEAALFAF